jgi:hypothetical protein
VFTWRVFAISAAVAPFAGSWLRGLTKRLLIRAISVNIGGGFSQKARHWAFPSQILQSAKAAPEFI